MLTGPNCAREGGQHPRYPKGEIWRHSEACAVLNVRRKLRTPSVSRNVEKLFLVYNVSDEVKSKSLIPLLTAQAKAL